MPPSGWIGSLERVDHLAVGRGRIEVGEVLGHGPAGDREAVAVQQPGFEQVPHHDRHAADAVEVDHVEPAVRLHVGDVGHACRDPVEVVELQLDAAPRWRWPAGGARRWSSRPGPLTTAMAFSNASLVMIWRGGCPARAAAPRPARLAGVVVAAAVDRGRRRRCRAATSRAPRPTEAMVLAVNMPAQPPSLGQALRSMAPQLLVGDGAGGVGADGLEHADDVERRALVLAGQDRAAVDEHRRQVEPGRGHQHARAALVAPGEGRPSASSRSACMTVSTESAMTSRDTSEARMPSWPMRCRRTRRWW